MAPASLADYNQNHVFAGIADVGTPGMNLTGAGTPERIFGIRASYNFLDVLGVQPAIGRGFLREEDRYGARHVVILTQELWQQRLGGRPDVIGDAVTLDEEPYEIIGVLPASFRSPEEISARQPMLFVIPDCGPPATLNNRGEHYDHAIARLKPGVTLAQAQSELDTIAARLEKAYPATNRKLAPLPGDAAAASCGSGDPAIGGWSLRRRVVRGDRTHARDRATPGAGGSAEEHTRVDCRACFAASRLLTSLLYEVKPFDPATFAVAVIVLGVVACLIPARRAARVDPVIALHYE